MRCAWVFLAALPLAGCLGGDDPTSPRAEGFVARYEFEDTTFTLTLDGPHDRLGADLVLRPAYRLRADDEGVSWNDRDAQYLDGAWQMVRDDGCSISSGDCERWSVDWRHTYLPAFDVPALGALWPLAEATHLQRSWRGDTLVIESTMREYGSCWEYEGTRAVPVRSCDGALRLVSYEAHDLAPIAAWPQEGRAAGGARANDLFPGADLDLQGFGYTSLDALQALREASPEAAQKLAAGGCVVTTLFGQGSGGFGTGFPAYLLETPLADTSFTVQDVNGQRSKYTVRWVEDNAGQRRFSTEVDKNSPDREGGPTCDEVRAQPWPTVGLQDFLQVMQSSFGPAGPGSVTISHQPHFLADGGAMHYAFTGTAEGSWGGAAIFFHTDVGRIGYTSYIGENDLEPEQNG